MSALCGWEECQRSERSTRGGKLLCFQGWTIDASLIHDAGFVENIAFAKLILKRPAYLGRDNQPDLSCEQPQFSLYHLFFFFVFYFSFSLSLSLFHSLAALRLTGLSRTSLTATYNNGYHRCLSSHPEDGAAVPFQSEYLYKFIGPASVIDTRPLPGNKCASGVDRQLYSPAGVLH